jgi:hypothetical protein
MNKNKKGGFTIKNSETGSVTAKNTTKSKGERQINFLRMLEELKQGKKRLTKN